MLTVQADNISASAWQDRKVFTVMYSGFDPKEETTVQRRQKDGNRITVTCPSGYCSIQLAHGRSRSW